MLPPTASDVPELFDDKQMDNAAFKQAERRVVRKVDLLLMP